MPKSLSEKRHAQRRFLERVGMELNNALYAALIKQIQRGEFKFVCRESGRVSVFAARLNHNDFLLVYDRKRHQIVTVLYAEGL